MVVTPWVAEASAPLMAMVIPVGLTILGAANFFDSEDLFFSGGVRHAVECAGGLSSLRGRADRGGVGGIRTVGPGGDAIEEVRKQGGAVPVGVPCAVAPAAAKLVPAGLAIRRFAEGFDAANHAVSTRVGGGARRFFLIPLGLTGRVRGKVVAIGWAAVGWGRLGTSGVSFRSCTGGCTAGLVALGDPSREGIG